MKRYIFGASEFDQLELLHELMDLADSELIDEKTYNDCANIHWLIPVDDLYWFIKSYPYDSLGGIKTVKLSDTTFEGYTKVYEVTNAMLEVTYFGVPVGNRDALERVKQTWRSHQRPTIHKVKIEKLYNILDELNQEGILSDDDVKSISQIITKN